MTPPYSQAFLEALPKTDLHLDGSLRPPTWIERTREPDRGGTGLTAGLISASWLYVTSEVAIGRRLL